MVVDFTETRIPPSIDSQLVKLREDVRWQGLDKIVSAQAEPNTFTDQYARSIFTRNLETALRDRQESIWNKDLRIRTPAYTGIIRARITNPGDLDATNINVDLPFQGEAEVIDPDNGKQFVQMPAVIKIAALRPSKECLISVWTDLPFYLGPASKDALLISSSTGSGKIRYEEAFRKKAGMHSFTEYLGTLYWGWGIAAAIFVLQWCLALWKRALRAEAELDALEEADRVAPNELAESSPHPPDAVRPGQGESGKEPD